MPVQSPLAKHRRPLATAAAAAGALLAVGFLPSANATPDETGDSSAPRTHHQPVGSGTESKNASGESNDFDGTPYVLCGIGAASLGGLLTARAQTCEFREAGNHGATRALK